MLIKIGYFFRRAAAYSIDILLVMFVVNCFITSNKVNIQYDEYKKYANEYYDFLLSYYEHSYNDDKLESCNDFKEAIAAKNLTEEKYVNSFEKLNTSLEKEKISKEEYDDKCLNLINEYKDDVISIKEFKEKESYYIYHLEKNYIVCYIVSIIVTILYLVLFQGFTYGQTLGKKIMRLKIVDKNGERVSYKSLFIRSVFLFSIIYYFLAILATFIVPVKYFTYSYNILNILDIVLSGLIIISILVSKDYGGIHGLISKTKVIFIDFKGNEIDLETGKTFIELEEEKKEKEKQEKANKVVKRKSTRRGNNKEK